MVFKVYVCTRVRVCVYLFIPQMADRDVARDRAAKLLVKRGSGSSFSQQEAKQNNDNRIPDRQRKPGCVMYKNNSHADFNTVTHKYTALY